MVLLSGGLDSATVLAIAKQQGFMPYTFLSTTTKGIGGSWSRRSMADHAGVARHQVISFDLRAFGGSALTSDVDVPKGRDFSDTGIPITYVPARNTIFLSFALAFAETL